MPRGDGTGPRGMGRFTGRGAGYCAGYTAPGYANSMGYGYGRGRGFRRRFFAPVAPRWGYFGHPAYDEAYEPVVDEKEALKRHADYLEGELDYVKKRLSDFKTKEEWKRTRK